MKCYECETRKATLVCPECGIKVCDWCHDELRCPACAPLLEKIKERKHTSHSARKPTLKRSAVR